MEGDAKNIPSEVKLALRIIQKTIMEKVFQLLAASPKTDHFPNSALIT